MPPWRSPRRQRGDAINPGPSVVAQYWGGGSATETVNGVVFSSGLSDYVGESNWTTGALNGFTTNNGAYNTILDGFNYDGTNPGTLTVTGLTPGVEYEVQLWGLDDRVGGINARTEYFSDGVNNSTTFVLGLNVSTTGTFIVDGTTTQVISVLRAAKSNYNLNASRRVPSGSRRRDLVGLGSLGLRRGSPSSRSDGKQADRQETQSRPAIARAVFVSRSPIAEDFARETLLPPRPSDF